MYLIVKNEIKQNKTVFIIQKKPVVNSYTVRKNYTLFNAECR